MLRDHTRRLPAVALAGVLGACTSSDSLFECQDDDGCVVSGVAGLCETNGYCSFPDEDCASGRRFGNKAPEELASVCVPPTADTDAPGSSTSGAMESSSSSSGTTTGAGDTEVADTTGGADSSSTSTGSMPVLEGNYVFVSSQTLEVTESVVEEGDLLCNELAQAAGLPGTFVAWLSSESTDARDRLRLDNVTAQGWIRPDGRPFANTVGELVLGAIFYPPVLDETGAHVGAVSVMTGTGGSGTRSDRCAGWTDTTAKDRYLIGQADSGFDRWTDDGLAACDIPNRVYCFGVDRVEEVTFTPVEGRRAFISESPLAANLGLDGFDEACAASAQNAGLDGSFKALIATTTAPALARFDLDGAPWVNTLGVPLTLEDAPLANVIRLDAHIGFLAGGVAIDAAVWSGAEAIGLTATSRSCLDWTTLDPTERGEYSRSPETVNWFGVGSEACDVARRVACFEE